MGRDVRKGKGIKYREINGLRCEERKRENIGKLMG